MAAAGVGRNPSRPKVHKTIFLHPGYCGIPAGMPQPAPARRPNADYRWSRDKIIAFVRALSETGSITASARVVGMSRQSAYRMRARMGAPFAELWDEAGRVGHRRRYLSRRRTAQGDRLAAR